MRSEGKLEAHTVLQAANVILARRALEQMRMARGHYDRLIDEGLAIEVSRESPVYERASVRAGCYGRVIVDLMKTEIVLTDGPGMVLWREKFPEFGAEHGK